MRTVLCTAWIFLATCSSLHAADEARRLVALVDYIGGDYQNAVQAGKIINPEEYGEMREFSHRALELLELLKAGGSGEAAGIESSLRTLASSIEHREKEAIVSGLAQRIKDNLIRTYKIAPYPRRRPSFRSGKALFSENCAECHGASGKGDGPSRESIRPKAPAPANFTDPNLMGNLSPFKAFNTITFGVAGTAMPSFSALAEEERWELAFYVFSLRFSSASAAAGKALFQEKRLPSELTALETLSTLSDERLQDRVLSHVGDQEKSGEVLAYLRRGLLEEMDSDPLLVARTLMDESLALYESGEKATAYQKAVAAYLDGFELAEPALFARNAPFGRSLEAQFAEYRTALKRGENAKTIRKLHEEIDSGLVRASEMVRPQARGAAFYTFLNSFSIILREGLEAALILSALLAMLRVMGAKREIGLVHLGWGLALLAGLLTWVSVRSALTLSGSHRESMEGFTALAAAMVLFYMGYWLHTKAEARKWQRFIRGKIEGALSGRRMVAIIGTSFLAVYREAFEVVLFYQALWLQSPTTQNWVIWGFVAGVVALSLLVFLLFWLGVKIPVRYFFATTGSLLFLLALVFAGKGVKELQTAGWFSITPIELPLQLPVLGIYPTLETLLAQGVMIVALLTALFWIGKAPENRPARGKTR